MSIFSVILTFNFANAVLNLANATFVYRNFRRLRAMSAQHLDALVDEECDEIDIRFRCLELTAGCEGNPIELAQRIYDFVMAKPVKAEAEPDA